MRFFASLFLTLLLFQSCSHNNDNKQDFQSVKNCNEVTMIYYNHNDTLTYNTNDTTEIAILTELISDKQDPIGDSCKPAGQIIFKSQGQKIFTAEFSTTDTNEEYECNFVVYNSGDKTYKHKLTYRAGRLIDEILWSKLRSSSLKINADSIKFYKDTIKTKKTINNR
ncbi:MAG TPA: hypothetical protein VFW07_04520 [Parafilimonas sp.]|nr:hypothetical protein [Parafilimonas sp.]